MQLAGDVAAVQRLQDERGAQRANKGHSMNQSLRRRNGLQRPVAVRRPHDGGGNARQNYEKYLARAHEAKLAGDVVEMESCYQHADHYFRVMRGTGDERSH
jgi:hypothetical protein